MNDKLTLDEYDRKILGEVIEVLTVYKVARAERETPELNFKGYWVQDILRVDISRTRP